MRASSGCTVRRKKLVVQFWLGLWRSWDAWSGDLALVFQMRGQRVSAENKKVVEALLVRRMPEGRRGDARNAKGVKGVPWQQNSAETAEGELVCMACVVSVQILKTVIEPRLHIARCFYSRREVELTKCGFSEDCEGCRVAASRDEVSRLCGKEGREAHQSGHVVRRRGPADTSCG